MFLVCIRYGNPEFATKEEIQNVLEKTNLNQTVSALHNGLDTIVGERGLMLSGGEKQRVNFF